MHEIRKKIKIKAEIDTSTRKAILSEIGDQPSLEIIA